MKEIEILVKVYGNPRDVEKKLNKVALDVTGNIENYRFGEAAHLLYDFVWHDFADKYLEETKDKEDDETKETLLYILADCLKLLHPFMPFITEEIYSKLPLKNKKLLLVESWPVPLTFLSQTSTNNQR